MVAKSDIAATRLRYEQQVYSLQTELNSLQVMKSRSIRRCSILTRISLNFSQKQCERFKRDRDSFKQLLEGAKKTIKELRSNSGRVSKGSMNSGDEDDKSKILILEQKVKLVRIRGGRNSSIFVHCSWEHWKMNCVRRDWKRAN